MKDDDALSIFSYDDDEDAITDSFNLTALTTVADKLLLESCVLEKLAEGGYHKVYNVKKTDGGELGVVVRVASPVFPKDKLESEVATIKYIAEKTTVPVPKVIAWDSNASNAVGAEYMFMSKVTGVSAVAVWHTLTRDQRRNTVRQVAKCISELWELRFNAFGSLYLADDGNGYQVGPIVDVHFYRTIDGVPRTKEPIDLNEFRGPFTSISSYLACGLRSELKMYSERREDLIAEADGQEKYVESGRKAIEKAFQLCDIYPGDRPISNDSKEPISLRLSDFRLSNIMINPETGDLSAFIDFELATTAPGWLCAELPYWLSDEYNGKGNDESIDPGDQSLLRDLFLDTIRGMDKCGTWRKAYEVGQPYREFVVKLGFFICVWGRSRAERWVECVLRWLSEHPGVGAPEDVEELYPDIQFSF